MDIEFVRSRFIKHFDGQTGNIYASPGRINLIGEHTDYNGGYVFPGAVDKGIMCEIRPNGTNTIMAYAIDLKDRVEFKVDDPEGPRTSWARYIYGIVQEMKKLVLEEGRPADCSGRLDKEIRTYDLLDALGISYERVEKINAEELKVLQEIAANTKERGLTWQ